MPGPPWAAPWGRWFSASGEGRGWWIRNLGKIGKMMGKWWQMVILPSICWYRPLKKKKRYAEELGFHITWEVNGTDMLWEIWVIFSGSVVAVVPLLRAIKIHGDSLLVREHDECINVSIYDMYYINVIENVTAIFSGSSQHLTNFAQERLFLAVLEQFEAGGCGVYIHFLGSRERNWGNRGGLWLRFSRPSVIVCYIYIYIYNIYI